MLSIIYYGYRIRYCKYRKGFWENASTGRDHTFAGVSNPARLRPGRLGCRSSDLRHFPRDIRIISMWILFKHLSLSCWSIHSRTLVSHARRQQSFIWFGLSFCNCEEAEDWRGWTDVGSISVYSEFNIFNPPDPCGHDWLRVGHFVGTLAIQAAWWEDGSDIMTQHLGAGGHMNAESSWPSITIYNVCMCFNVTLSRGTVASHVGTMPCCEATTRRDRPFFHQTKKKRKPPRSISDRGAKNRLVVLWQLTILW